MPKNRSKYYVTNKELLPYIYLYRRTIEYDEKNEYIEGSGELHEELGRMILKIATNYANKGSFSGYTWKDDMIAEAVFTCIKYLHNFDPMRQKRPNPFAYITTVIHNSFLNYIRKQKKHSEIKDICYKNQHVLDEENHFSNKAINYELLRNSK